MLGLTDYLVYPSFLFPFNFVAPRQVTEYMF
jgi:hypothetical protein